MNLLSNNPKKFEGLSDILKLRTHLIVAENEHNHDYMNTKNKNGTFNLGGIKMNFEGKLVGTDLKVAIVVSRFNDFITNRLLDGAKDTLVSGEDSNIDVAYVLVHLKFL